MLIKTGTSLYIHKLRITSNERNTPALQLRQANRLSAMSLHPANLSPHAILCIRTVHDPRQQQKNSIQSAHDWEQAVSANIKHLLDHASRPIQEEVGDNASAVLFADHAEMLACVASDWLQGKLTQHWWWRNLLGRQDMYSAFISAWIETPEHIPAALQHLATQNQAIPFIHQLPPPVISALLAGILRTFSLYALQAILSRQAREGQPPIVKEMLDWEKRQEMDRPLAGEMSDAEINFWDATGQAAFPHEITEEGQKQALKNASRHKPDGQEWLVDSGETGLSIEQQMLLTISLMLVRTPTIVRSTAFTHAARQWLQENAQEREPLNTHLSGNDASISHTQSQNAFIENSRKQEDTTQQKLYTSTQETSNDIPPLQKNKPLTPNSESFNSQLSHKVGGLTVSYSPNTSLNKEKHTPQTKTNTAMSAQPHITFQYQDDKTTHLSIDNLTIGISDIQEHKDIQDASLIFVEDTDDKENIEIPDQDVTGLTQSIYRKQMSGRRADQPIASIEADKSGLLQDSSIGAFCSASVVMGETARGVIGEAEVEAGVTGEAEAGDEPPARRGHHVWQGSTRQMPEKGLETAFGGLFYLINVGIYLELYGDFTTPAQPGIPLTIWDFLALLGFRLVGATIQDDPLWPLLSLLAGRGEQEPPGIYFEPLADWRLPALWLKPFPNENIWQWEERQGRLYVYHPAGFLILDIPMRGNRGEQLKQEMQAYAEYGEVTLTAREEHLSPSIVTPDQTSNPPGTSSPVIRWLDWLAPYLYARLQRALGTNDNPIPTVCMQNAYISISTTHLDVYLSLATLPIEVRIAGLDRNPGWVPAAGRYVTFYFE